MHDNNGLQFNKRTINTKHHQVVFNYLNKPQSERQLPLCEDSRACNVVHKRYWLPPVADRLCRCKNREECQWRWSDQPDNFTMFLNNRSQFKFCTPINNMNHCSNSDLALTIEQSDANSARPLLDVHIHCQCPMERYWKHEETIGNLIKPDGTGFIIEQYKCVNLEKCDANGFCGYVRIDYSSVYYRCSCPIGHLCMFPNTTIYVVNELLFKGKAYRAKCTPFKTKDNDYY